MPKVQAFFEALRHSEEGNFAVGAAGFCWGGLHVLKLAHGMSTADGKSLVDVVFTGHPSNVDIPGDFKKIWKPTSLAIGDKDFVMPLATVEKVREIWGKLESVNTEIQIYPGAGHGFSIRADPLNEKQAEQSVAAEAQAIGWFEKHFDALAR
jgi:dienelactone hydrolase